MRLGIRIRRKKGKIKDYAYITARVRARRRKLLRREDYQKLLKMSLEEIARFLGETEYREEIEELSDKYSGVELVERALTLNLSRTYRNLMEISSGEPNLLIREYLRRWDIWNLRSLLRGKRTGADPEEIKSLFVVAGELDESFLSALAELKSIDEVIEALSRTRYYEILKRHEEMHWRELEDELEKRYYEELVGILEEERTEDRKLLLRIIRREIDIKNLMTLLRLKKDGVEPRDIEHHLIMAGEELTEMELKRLLNMSYEEILRTVGDFSYGRILGESAERSSLTTIEAKLEKHLGEFAHKLSYHYPLSILPVIGYIISKRHEVRNLQLIARGKSLGVPQERLEEGLVI
ncbi:MAG: V/A-type H+/Na+-transporting ATPase subunit [Archaeoglobi archaeon]|nr:ATP synthase A1 subunit C [Candidatus Mnemosynella bozhongmuii]MDK2781641.1 V/A-type H+/Na+-transporting ATPase subunit [Archaeoglobi archaeon]